jgi:hypothetical protein
MNFLNTHSAKFISNFLHSKPSERRPDLVFADSRGGANLNILWC